MSHSFFNDYFDYIRTGIVSVNKDDLIEVSNHIKAVSQSGKKLMIAGNGGSAALSSHVSVDFTKAAGVRAINFNEADLLTCFANDYGFHKIYEKAIEFYGDSGDALILVSSSGSSQNVVNAAKRAKELNMSVITFSGFQSDNPLRSQGDFNFWVDSSAYNIVEMTHHVWLLSIVDYIIGNVEYPAS